MSQNTKQEQLRTLLDEQIESKRIVGISGKMGNTDSLITFSSISWIAERIEFVQDLPIWGETDSSGNVERDFETVEMLQQRDLNWNREEPMVFYLTKDGARKFPPLLVVACNTDWIKNLGEKTQKWLETPSSQNIISLTPMDSHGKYVSFEDKDLTFYALDGQHRLMGIKRLHKLFRYLSPDDSYNDDYKIHEKLIKKIQKHQCNKIQTREKLQDLVKNRVEDSIGIEIIQAIQKNEKPQNGLRRLRSIFVHVNRNAKRLSKGELASLDEENGFSIIARWVSSKHPFLEKRVNHKQGQLAEISNKYTTLETLVAIARNYLGNQYSRFSYWKETAGQPSIRPNDSELSDGTDYLMKYFDLISQLPSHENFIKKEYEHDYRKKGKEENILFRPIAQEALAKALGILRWEQDHHFEDIIDILIAQEKKGQFVLREKKSIWFGVLCDLAYPHRMKNRVFYKELCCELFVYLISKNPPDPIKEKQLKEKFKLSRKIDELRWINLTGEDTNDTSSVKLPSPWS